MKNIFLVLAGNKQKITDSGFSTTVLETVSALLMATALNLTKLGLIRPWLTTFEMLDLCLCGGFYSPEIMEILLRWVNTPPTSVSEVEWVHIVLLKFTAALVDRLKSHNLDITKAPFRDFFLTVMSNFTTKVLPNPLVLPCQSEELNCACAVLRPFFAGPSLKQNINRSRDNRVDRHIQSWFKPNFQTWGASLKEVKKFMFEVSIR